MKPAGRDLASSPDASPAELLAAATTHPDEVLANPALPLLALEDPAAYERVRRDALLSQARLRVEEAVARLDDRRKRRFAADCAERLLPCYEADHPGDLRPRRAISAARRYATGRASSGELAERGRAVEAAYLFVQRRRVRGPAPFRPAGQLPEYAAGAALEATNPDASRAALDAAYTGVKAAIYRADAGAFRDPRAPMTAADLAAELAERAWQLKRLTEYLNPPTP
jgi:hypothetical protein